MPCPGVGCPAYRVVFGTDYAAAERGAQLRALRSALGAHLAKYPQSLVVVEEYDKMDCASRALVRTMLDGGGAAPTLGGDDNGEGVSIDLSAPQRQFGESIFVLESNVGYLDIYRHAEDAREGAGEESESETPLSDEEADRTLKDAVFDSWLAQECESRVDTQRLLGLIDAFVPFQPLRRTDLAELAQRRLEVRRLLELDRFALSWEDSVPDWLAGRAEYEYVGGWAIEGAKEIDTIISRHVTRALREWARSKALPERERHPQHRGLSLGATLRGAALEYLRGAGVLPEGEDAVKAEEQHEGETSDVPSARLVVYDGKIRAIDGPTRSERGFDAGAECDAAARTAA